jgi:hypothetical protein
MVAGLRRRRGTPFALRREACLVVAGLACAVRWFGGLQGWRWVGASCLHCGMLEGVSWEGAMCDLRESRTWNCWCLAGPAAFACNGIEDRG